MSYHTPVLIKEVDFYLNLKPCAILVDATFGGGGHSKYLFDKYKDIKIIALDCDESAYGQFLKMEKEFGGRLIFVRENFKNIDKALLNLGIEKVDAILADIGVSSNQFDDLQRGFSFNSKNLDMRMDASQALDAKEIINTYDEKTLADIFYQYGQERFSRVIARAVVEYRKTARISSGQVLADIISRVKKSFSKVNPSTLVFQALRIFVNDELENLKQLLNCAPPILNQDGRLVVISFHSLEDKIVKENIKNNAANNIYKNLTKKVVCANGDEIFQNPRARSAKLRAAQKL
ncbi:MAG: 16S rRNA (cytosine(1402)-N(4))-methyltransferase RsmH [Elusimicrobiota bacterium]|jgi:16S rRNA (cytosine1402-N4)-methyltransferase|nr:16S rRNA (cytosine(1402)-N(4))-methyltransferase RsmH [Elusimicrobiota bacterium]